MACQPAACRRRQVTPAARSVAEQARDAAAARLKRAEQFTAMHCSKPLFSKVMRRGGRRELVRLEWPGVLRVYDPDTGEILAESLPGQPSQLRG